MKFSAIQCLRRFLPIALLLFVKEISTQGTYIGCFKENHRARVFATSAGTYDPSNVSPTICMAQCQRWDYRYSALTEGSFCFCSSQLPVVAASADGYCDQTCSSPSASGAKCGGLDYISVYEVALPVIGLELNVIGQTSPLVQVGTVLQFNLTRIDGPSNVYYAVDFGDGTGLTPYNDTNMLFRSYSSPGEYFVTAHGNDSAASKTGVSVSIQAPVNYLEFYCPPQVASLEEFRCNATIMAGTYLNLTIKYGDGVVETFAVADPYYFTAGPGIPHWTVTTITTDTSGQTFIMPDSEFLNDGIILAFEYYSTGTSGSITFLVLNSCPTASYCYTDNSCGAGCVTDQMNCGSSGFFCPKNKACGSSNDSTCQSGNNRYITSSSRQYQIVQSIGTSISGSGRQIFPLDPTNVPLYAKKGYVIGYTAGSPGTIATRGLLSNEVSDLLATTACGSSCSGTVTNSRHWLRAIAAKPTNILFFHTYTIPDIYLVLVEVKNDLLPSAPHALANQTVLVAIGINISTIVAPAFVGTNNVVHIYLEAHTGSNVTYLWSLGDGTELNTTTPWLNYTYTKRGCYWANNTAYNAISRKSSNLTLICVEDLLTNLTVVNNISDASQVTLFWFKMLWGSDYICDWSYGDGATDQTNPTSTPISGVVWTHRYVSDGAYPVNVTCYNNISTQTAIFTQYVEWPIINLRLLKNGTLNNAPFQITYLIDNGTAPSFNFTFDGTLQPSTYTTLTKTGITTQFPGYSHLGVHQVVVNGWNHISFVTLVVNFTIESRIVNPQSICDLLETVSDQLVTYTASVSDGSDVNITWNFVDGSAPVNYLQTPGVSAYPDGLTQIQKHAFPRGGLFIVQVTICNQLDSYTFNQSIIVYGKIENITLFNSGPVPFIRGQGLVNFTFVSLTPPFNVAVMFVYGNGQNSSSLLFDINGIYPYNYQAEGTYQVMANISNRLTWGPVATTVIVAQPVINMYLYFEVPHPSIYISFKAGVGMDVGPGVTLLFDFGDNTPPTIIPRTATNAYQLDNATHVYSALGTYNITVIAINAIGNTTQRYIAVVQYPVITSFVLTSTAPVLYPTGLVQFTLTYPSSDVLPSDASMQFFWGDNTSSPVMLLPFSTSPYSFNISHTYPRDGNFVAQCVIFNLCSNQTFNVSAGAYIPISALNVTATYQPVLPCNGPLQPGFGVLQNTFPRDSDIVFNTALTGTVTYYQVTIMDKNGNILMIANETSSPFSLDYLKNITSNGQYTVLIKAGNPLSSQTYSININVNRTVSDAALSVSPTSGPTSTNWNFLTSFQDVGYSTCVVIDFGDGTKGVYGNDSAYCAQVTSLPVSGPLTNPLTVAKKYSASKTYVATVSAYDPLGNASTNVNIVVSGLDCTLPNIDIKDKKPFFTDPRLWNRADPLDVVGITALSCPLSVANTKSWAVYLVSEGTGEALVRLTNITSLPTVWNAEILVPPLFLAYGLYRFTYSVQIDATPFLSNVSTYIRIVPTPIIAILATNGMSMITRGYGGYIAIEPGKFSYDPDLGPNQQQVFDNFIWYCRQMDELFSYDPAGNIMPGTPSVVYTEAQLAAKGNATSGGCFRQGPGIVSFNGGSLNFTSKNMRSNDTYKFQVTVIKGNRASTSELLLDLVDGIPPSVEIGCIDKNLCTPLTKKVRINPTNRVSLYANCIADCPSPLIYDWTIYRLGLNGAWLPLSNSESYVQGVNGTNSREIAISDQLFIDGFILYKNLVNYRVGVTVSNPNNPPGSVSGSSYMEFYLNTPPNGGSCQVTPTVGLASSTLFSFSCQGWFDPDGIDLYQFYANLSDGEDTDKQLGYSDLGNLGPMALPQGSPDDNYMVTVWVRVFDTYGAFTTYYNMSVIKVFPMTQSESQTLLNQLLNNKTSANQLQSIAAQGDIVQMSSTFLGIADALNTATIFANKQYGNGSLTYPFEGAQDNVAYQAQRDAESKLRGSMIQGLANATLNDIESIQLVSSTLSKVTDVVSQVNRLDQEKATDIVQDMYDKMSTISSTTPIEEFILATKTIASTMGNLFQSINDNADDGTLTDHEQCKSTSFYFYDTNWETSRKGFLGMSEDDMENQFVKETNNLAQKYSATSTVRSLTNTLDNLGDLLLSKQVPGEQPISINTSRLSLFLQKDLPSKIAGRTVDIGGGEVTLPTWCNMAPKNINCTDSTPISIKMSATPKNIFTYFPDGSMVSPSSETITIDTTDENGNQILISNTQQPIEITIPRTNMVTPRATTEASYMSKKDDTSDLFYFKFNVTEKGASLQVEIHPEHPGVQFLLFGRLGTFPKLNGSRRGWDFMQRIPQSMSNLNESYYGKGIDPYVVFVDNKAINDRLGLWYIGLRQLDPTEYDLYNDTNTPAPPTPQTGRFNTNYSLLIYTSGCYYCKQNATRWSYDGCTVSPKTSVAKTVCLCNHLTSFGGGFAVRPNAIDFDFVFANASFLKNATLYITEMIIAVVYVLLLIWARRQDKKDLIKLGVTPLPDNDPRDQYLYELIVSTGLRKNAGTESKVHIILSGDYDETDARTMEDDERKILGRGSTDSFLMTVPRPLGPLNYARIWHDNSGKGKYASWYLNWILVRDVQTGQKFHFIANRWFAVEEDDGQINRLVPVCGREQIVETGHLFSRKTSKGISDDHIWFSVIGRPVTSRFTRIERLSCCLCLLFTAMLANAMFYDVVGTTSGSGLSIGPFTITPEQIYVGIISNLIVFPVNFVIAFLFKKSRPRRKRPSRIGEALKKMKTRQGKGDLNDFARRREEAVLPGHRTGQNDLEIAPSIDDDHGKKFDNRDLYGDRPQTARSVDLVEVSSQSAHLTEVQAKKKEKFSLPWWCVIIGWVLLWITVALCVAFVTFYGISFQDEKCRKWITSMLISFVTSVFLTQPIKVVLLALLFSILFKKPENEDEDDEDEESLELENDEIWLHQNGTAGPYRKRFVKYEPPDPVMLERARENRLKELKMYSILREVILYMFFLWIVIVISYDFRDPNAQFVKANLEKTFVDGSRGVNATPNTSIDLMTSMEDFWGWMENTFIPSQRADDWYNGQRPIGLRGYLNDIVSRIMGYATMRQLRVKRGRCEVPHLMRTQIHECNVQYSPRNEDVADYNVGWVPRDPGDNSTVLTEYHYTDASDLNGYPFLTKHNLYNGGGYVAQLRGDRNDLFNKLASLKQGGWIDKYTRAVFLEFSIYNVQANMFACVTMVAELLESSGFDCYYYIEPMNLIGDMSSGRIFIRVCQIVYLVFIVFFIGRETRNIWKQRRKYFTEFWNWVELWIIALSIGSVIVFAYRYMMTGHLLKIFAESGGNAYMKFQGVAYWNEMLLYMIGLLVFWATLKFIKLLRFNKIMGLLGSTLRYASKSLLSFSLMFAIMFFAFVQCFYLIYNASLETFSNVVFTAEECLQMMVGKFNFGEIVQASPILGTFMFFVYMIVVFFILLTMFVTIINEAFASVRDDVRKQSNDHEMVDFLVDRFKQWTGIASLFGQTGNRGKLNNTKELSHDPKVIEAQINNLPERLDRFLDCISQVYFQQDNFESIFASHNVSGKKLLKDTNIKAELYGKTGSGKGPQNPRPNPNLFGVPGSNNDDRQMPNIDLP